MAKVEDEEEVESQEDNEGEENVASEEQASKHQKQQHQRHVAPSRTHKGGHVDLFEPMFLWVALLLIAVAARTILATTSYFAPSSQLYAIANAYPNFILQFPGIIVLPLIIGLMIGAEVGRRSTTLESALRSGLLNGVYASIIYIIAIVIVYIVMSYVVPQFASESFSLLNSIIFPIAVFILTLEIFSVLSYSRRVDE